MLGLLKKAQNMLFFYVNNLVYVLNFTCHDGLYNY